MLSFGGTIGADEGDPKGHSSRSAIYEIPTMIAGEKGESDEVDL